MSGDPTTLSLLLQATVAGFSVLGGVMAACSGHLAAKAYDAGHSRDEIEREASRGVALGYKRGVELAALAAMIVIGS